MPEATRIALVTGAGTGIGRAAAVALAADGWTLALAGRRREPLEETAREVGRDCLIVPTDVADPEAVRALFEAVRGTHGRLDLLFNNAGIGAPAVPPDELALSDWLAVVNVNLNGAFYCAREAFGMMRAQSPRGGRIINNGSISAQSPRPLSAPYTATKHAITGLTKSLSLDGRPYDIACSQIDIGNAETDMARRMRTGVPQADGSVRAEPLMDVVHVGRAVAYMASLPLDANVQFMTLMATKAPLIGRG